MIDALLSMERPGLTGRVCMSPAGEAYRLHGALMFGGAGWCSSWPRSGPAGPSFPACSGT